MELHGHVAAVVPEVAGDETTAALLAAATVIPVADTVDFSEDGGYVRILGTVYEYLTMDDGEDTGAPSITLATGLLGAVPAETLVEVWNASTGTVVIEWKVDVTDDTDGSTAVATLSHALIPLVADGIPLDVGESVKVTVDEEGDWWVTEILGSRPFVWSPISTDVLGNSRIEVGQGSSFGNPAHELRIYTGDDTEVAPGELSGFTETIPFTGGKIGATTLMQSPTLNADPAPYVRLRSSPADSSENTYAEMQAETAALTSSAGPSVTVSSTGVVVGAGTLQATMGAGSVGAGTFRDSVDARVAAAPATLGYIERAADGTQTTTTGAAQAIVLWATSVVAGRGGVSYSAGTFTVTTAGTYLVVANALYAVDATGTGRRLVSIRRNGNVVANSNIRTPALGEAGVVVTALVDCVASDTIDVRATQDSGGTLAITTTSRISIRNLG